MFCSLLLSGTERFTFVSSANLTWPFCYQLPLFHRLLVAWFHFVLSTVYSLAVTFSFLFHWNCMWNCGTDGWPVQNKRQHQCNKVERRLILSRTYQHLLQGSFVTVSNLFWFGSPMQIAPRPYIRSLKRCLEAGVSHTCSADVEQEWWTRTFESEVVSAPGESIRNNGSRVHHPSGYQRFSVI